MKSVLITIIVIFQIGCVTARLNGPEKLSSQDLRNQQIFLDEAKVSIDDSQFTWIAGEIYPSNLYAFRKMPEGPLLNEIKVTMPECEMTKGFWANPFTLVTALGFTVGNIYECKTLIHVMEVGQSTSRSYETTTEYFGFTGLGALLWGPFMGAMVGSKKIDQIRSTIYLYMKDMNSGLSEP